MPQCSSQLSCIRVVVLGTRSLRNRPTLPRKAASQLLGGSVKLATKQALTQKLEAHQAPPSACSMQLATTCVLLFVGASGAGLLPLILKTSPAQLRLLSAIGAGLLVGTGLGVILPEGFEAFHSAQEAAGSSALPEGLLGTTLLAGFLAMLVLDVLHQSVSGDAAHSHDRASPTAHSASNGDLEHERHAFGDPSTSAVASSNPITALIGRSDEATRALIGLIIHSAADGLAVGASSLSTDTQLTSLIALAMVLHKVPAAIGLTSYLRGKAWPLKDALQALLVFSSASPLVALACAAFLTAVPSLSSSPAAIALCLIFSGGTFLYAACLHVLPESLSGKGRHAVAQAGCVIFASCVPLVFSFWHHH
ncbi:hypothetical protein WJX84_003387 [Apatococcus fuscideae]|uniref:Uncharacterized protein n=1 Tax=Apatococcus fuscideae TaxID=2026836 RepID=A0AAW1RZQ3_9CHLO